MKARHRLLLSTALGLSLAACADADAPIGASLQEAPGASDGEQPGTNPSGSEGDPASGADQNTVDRQVMPYPAGPYGVAVNSTIANFQLYGWTSPRGSGFQASAGRTISLAEFYDPNGTKGNEVLMVSAVATWCSACRVEYTDLQEANLVEQYRPRGVVFYGALFENQDAAPPSYADLEAWVSAFDVDFPFTTDPALKLGVFFERQATPMNMIVDLRTMKILHLQTGYNAELFGQLDQFLTKRGR